MLYGYLVEKNIVCHIIGLSQFIISEVGNMVDEKRYLSEVNYLEKVKELIRSEIIGLEQEIIDIPKKYRHRYSDVAGGDEDLVAHLIEMAENRKKR